jgi:glucokinase
MSSTIGVDLGGTKMMVGVVAPGPRVLYSATSTDFGDTAEAILDGLEREVRTALESEPDARAVGLGIPCTIDRANGVAVSSVNLPIVGVPVRELMRERLGMDVHIDNDANTAALAEHLYGAARGARNAVVLTVGTGVGGGLIVEGEVFRGSTGAGAELGHVVVEAEGPPCQGNCPSRGCVETMASGTAIGREGRAIAEREPESALGRLLSSGREIDGVAVTEAALAGDTAARLVVERAGYYLGVALAGYANVFDPDVIVIGGGVTKGVGDMMLDPARAELAARAVTPQNRVPVVVAELGPEAGMIGAAAMAARELERL